MYVVEMACNAIFVICRRCFVHDGHECCAHGILVFFVFILCGSRPCRWSAEVVVFFAGV